jgi:hypothetical protein
MHYRITTTNQENDMLATKINGRNCYFDRLDLVKKNINNEYIVRRGRMWFTVFGGRQAGGSSRDWWVESDEFAKPIVCTSLVGALRLIDTM